ncbi:UDP-N-acetylmuramoyl-L-alanine--D-glutamate ligase [Microvirga tunisiensis]|uniref:UDP-N-acetylmuramoylalanine--D-glutamate ligase n=1 Tax=Pannonibacter tanglangensis TaxID=2750084 RepID=A0A7X5F1F5_9HYPH|nr:UDP-N-acetylmuramoyl-L-alanine--D-glutamate ligase [Pannonibacter sp. XCT-53]NBN77005.1 UDP-N-acetylmuramoyl-L-alanine--D-glutamate ligase [Pannonibacter sp. XCT-53]
MIPITSFAGQTVALFGLGGSGLSSALALKAGGATVIVWDDAPARIEVARARGLAASDLAGIDWDGVAALVLSPGVPLTHPEPHWTVRLARAAGVEVIGDIELFVRERRRTCPEAPLICITGTNGKSTTTALVAHLVRSLGLDVQMGGNIGTPVFDLEPPVPGRHYVIECSSYQIDLAPSLDPTVGIHMNLSPDHLDRHGTMENYAAIKERLVAGSHSAVIGVDDPMSAAMADRLALSGKRVRRISGHLPQTDGVYGDGGRLMMANQGRQERLADLAGIDSLRGRHNAQNAAAACAALLELGHAPERIAAALRTFPGLRHRMQIVARRNGTLFVNDSKATNADAAAWALASYPRIYWIAGGKPKTGGIDPLGEFFPRIVRAYLIGEAAEAFARTLDGKAATEICGTMDVAVARAAADAALDPAAEKVVLLSPACASFDQYPNFEVRGDAFVAAVEALDGASETEGDA